MGACAVHMLNGIWGTIAVGLFATDTAPAFARGFGDGAHFGANQILGKGLLYGGGFKLLGVQLLGLLATAGWTAITIYITFAVIRKTVGLRAAAEEEIEGLDVCEHGLPSAYADFAPAVNKYATYAPDDGIVAVTSDVPMAEAVPVKKMPSFAEGEPKFTKVEIICKESRFDALKAALTRLGITGMTVSHVLCCGVQGGKPEYYRGVAVETNLLPKIQVDVVVSKIPVRTVIETAKKVLYTGHIGDGKIFVYDVENVVKVRTGEEGYDALQDVE